MKSHYQHYGFYVLKHAINDNDIKQLTQVVSQFETSMHNYGIRDLMRKVPAIRKLALSSSLLSVAKEILGPFAQPVRSVFFDKLPEANWNVAWHQDTSIAVKKKVEIPGFDLWSIKQGIVHVEPPETYLANMLTLRIHLDITNTENGVLRVIPGSHRYGRVNSKALLNLVENSEIVECHANPGDMLLMNPLLFHSSRKAINPSHRRVIHIEYTSMQLPKPLEWYEC